ncbi:Protein-tyrosine-phosphatase [Vibrio chagasii]|nr:Protein-tyrosine-phosphatase [Vibrio chagasii]CAH6963646.1 Protein-tyrosine-phosphatase [Vibrio chagasii]CAH6986234.1 Protein-tyrosine-phosphatase [Vibrio chagasii]CAH7043330.1 Protein-tyrosine-phosphatase [Vibrio chagasii]CAH7214715.1 Protein-tyrosine-phosphatase [Vibrio chagasii]
MSTTPINILFVCVKKGVRAAIAKAIVEQKSNGMIQATCSGFETGGTPQAILDELSNLLCVPIQTESKTVFEYKKTKENFDYVITLCDQISIEQCNLFVECVNVVYSHIPNKLRWNIPNLGVALELSGDDRTMFVKEVVDQITFEVSQLVANTQVKN